MVVGAFPAAKLGTLLLKQISKPIANAVKAQAKNSPVFRKYVCMPPAQFYNWCEVQTKMWILNLGKPVNIPVLNEAMAIELGANLLGEGIIFLIAAGILISEYNRSSRKEAAKEEAKEQEMVQIQNTIRELFIQSEEQGALIRELTRKIGELETRLAQKPSNPKSTPSGPSSTIGPSKTIQPSTHHSSEIHPTFLSPKEELTLKFIDHSKLFENKSSPQFGLILRAVEDVEDQFWNYPLIERQSSILMLSLYHISKLFKFQQ